MLLPVHDSPILKLIHDKILTAFISFLGVQKNHWALAVVDLKNKSLQYYDSMLGYDRDCLNNLAKYVQAESTKIKHLETANWTRTAIKHIPSQTNFSDCGVFMLKYAEYIASDSAMNFKQHHMTWFRKRIVLAILAQGNAAP